MTHETNETTPDSQLQDTRPPPLAGVVVIDLTHIYNGPYATFLMAMAGADVIKVEPPAGEHLRHRAELGGAAAPFAMLNANKRAITLNLKSERGCELLLDIVAKADVLVENFAPGVLDRLGVGHAVLAARNPRLIYASSTGYGLSGPYREYPAMDLTIQAMCGVLATTGFPDQPPVKAGPALCDFLGGVHLYGGIVTALYEREKTGLGRFVEVSMQEASYSSLSSSIGMYFGSGMETPQRTGNRHSGLVEAPYNVYPTRDGFIAIIGNNDRHFRTLLRLMEREDLLGDPRFAGLRARADNMQAIDDLLEAWTLTFDKQALADLLLASRVPASPVRDVSEVVNDPHMHARGALEWMDHPQFGRLVLQRGPMRYHGTPSIPLAASQTLGSSNADVYSNLLGLDADEIAALARDAVV